MMILPPGARKCGVPLAEVGGSHVIGRFVLPAAGRVLVGVHFFLWVLWIWILIWTERRNPGIDCAAAGGAIATEREPKREPFPQYWRRPQAP
jgi:hypothetical protein